MRSNLAVAVLEDPFAEGYVLTEEAKEMTAETKGPGAQDVTQAAAAAMQGEPDGSTDANVRAEAAVAAAAVSEAESEPSDATEANREPMFPVRFENVLGSLDATARTYVGTQDGSVFVRVPGGRRRCLNPRFDIIRHSQKGFRWGSDDGGTAQLALAILSDALNDDVTAVTYYQEFKTTFVAMLPPGHGWELDRSKVLKAVRQAERRQWVIQPRGFKRGPTPGSEGNR